MIIACVRVLSQGLCLTKFPKPRSLSVRALVRWRCKKFCTKHLPLHRFDSLFFLLCFVASALFCSLMCVSLCYQVILLPFSHPRGNWMRMKLIGCGLYHRHENVSDCQSRMDDRNRHQVRSKNLQLLTAVCYSFWCNIVAVATISTVRTIMIAIKTQINRHAEEDQHISYEIPWKEQKSTVTVKYWFAQHKNFVFS